jgi:hypothetical protein
MILLSATPPGLPLPGGYKISPLFKCPVSLLIGDALQDRFALFARQLVDRGKRVLAAER